MINLPISKRQLFRCQDKAQFQLSGISTSSVQHSMLHSGHMITWKGMNVVCITLKPSGGLGETILIEHTETRKLASACCYHTHQCCFYVEKKENQVHPDKTFSMIAHICRTI